MTISSRLPLAAVTALLAGLIAAPTAWAQQRDKDDWRQGTALSIFGGASATSAETSPAVGAALAWELTPRFTVEGSGIWAEGSHDSSAFAAAMMARVNLLPRRTIVPFVGGGIGMYRASFGANADAMPSFYRRRMTGGSREFTDFAVAVGGGTDIFLHRHLALRPDVRVLLVTAESSVLPVTVLGLHLSYHFESHNVTPSRRAK